MGQHFLRVVYFQTAFVIVLVATMTGIPGHAASANQSSPFSQMNNTDRDLARSARQQALEKAKSGESFFWRNHRSDRSGTITPQKTYRTKDGTYCRRYAETVTAEFVTEIRMRTACRTKARKWRPWRALQAEKKPKAKAVN